MQLPHTELHLRLSDKLLKHLKELAPQAVTERDDHTSVDFEKLDERSLAAALTSFQEDRRAADAYTPVTNPFNPFHQLDYQQVKQRIEEDPESIAYLSDPPPELLRLVLRPRTVVPKMHVLRFVHQQTEEMCLAAVRQNGLALSYVNEQTDAICLAAVQQNGLALEYVVEQTEEICLAAVRQNGLALSYVYEQTDAICLAAVQQNPEALEYVRNQTPEIVRAAITGAGITDEGFEHYPVGRYLRNPA